MKVEYDMEADAKYIRFSDGDVARTKKEKDWLIFDYSKESEVIGLEILDASKNQIRIHTIGGKLVRYQGVDTKPLEADRESFGFSFNMAKRALSLIS